MRFEYYLICDLCVTKAILTFFILCEKVKLMAEEMGFEPTIQFPVYTLSKRAPSTARPILRIFWNSIFNTPKIRCRYQYNNLILKIILLIFITTSFLFKKPAHQLRTIKVIHSAHHRKLMI